MYAYIAFPIANYQQFIYSIPLPLSPNIKEGVCIYASFRNKMEYGFVISLVDNTSFKNKIKVIDSIAKLQLPNELWKTIIWISTYYICPIGIILKSAIPLLFKNNYKAKEKIYLKITSEGKDAINCWGTKAPKQLEFLNLLNNEVQPKLLSELSHTIQSAGQIYKKLYDKKLISIISEDDIIHLTKYNRKINLNEKQSLVFNQIKSSIDKLEYKAYLLHGITGSGKTEVYIKLAAEVIQQNKAVIILVPEISLTPQLSQKFIDTFGSKVGLWHSKLTQREKYKTWQGLHDNKYSIIIGARSAIFTPISNLGLIIVDEEHDPSYKQESSSFKYHARDVGMIRAKYSNSTILLGSATPSVESYYHASNKNMTLLKIDSRYQNASYPSINIIDMKKGRNRFSYDFSYELVENMKRCFKNSEQIIILHNRRGFSTICRCEDCGEVLLCSNCSISLTYHANGDLVCHYCSSTYSNISECNICHSQHINFIGTGTQKIEFEIQKLFPEIRIARMDFDTMKNYKNYKKILQDFSNHKYDVLLGTQMVSKGLDFKDVTLVGVINGDTSLYIPDFRSGERTFQLLYQVCGRAGRSDKESNAIIQSWNPDNIFIQMASQLNIDHYYNTSLADRETLNYPPFCKLIRIVITGRDKNSIKLKAHSIKKKLNNNSKQFIILGPSIAPIEKINNNWRYHLLMKVKKHHLAATYKHIEKHLGFKMFYNKTKSNKVEIEVDPISIL